MKQSERRRSYVGADDSHDLRCTRQAVRSMRQTRDRAGQLICLVATALSGAISFDAAAQAERVNAVIGEQARTEQAMQASERRVEALDDEATRMLAEYRQMLAESQSLKVYNEQLAVQVKSQQTEMDGSPAAERDRNDVARSAADDGQDARDARSVREARHAVPARGAHQRASRSCKDMMTRADVRSRRNIAASSRPTRSKWNTAARIEAYQGKVGDKTVDFLRAGRVSLMYQTLDGKETGYWDADARSLEDRRFVSATPSKRV